VQQGDWLLLTFRARSTQPFPFPGVGVLLGKSPWTRYARSGPAERIVDTDWETYELAFEAQQTAEAGCLHISLGGVLPAGTVFEFQPLGLHAATPAITDPLSVDVGNIIFDGGVACGWKKWSIDDLSNPYDYYYDPAAQRVYLVSDQSPPSRHPSIELALARHVVNQSGKQHVVYDGLAVMYGAAHGFGGGNTQHLTIRNCDLGYIGGAHQLTRPDGRPVRYGNAIEFWGAARDHLVEGCRIWEVYDARAHQPGPQPGLEADQHHLPQQSDPEFRVLVRILEPSRGGGDTQHPLCQQHVRIVYDAADRAAGWAHVLIRSNTNHPEAGDRNALQHRRTGLG
jgi:hypothetical protein